MKKKDENEKKHFIRPQTCRNCGVNGHLYKDCLRPIMSFGIICYKKLGDDIKYLMIQRKDSLSFMEFIRGKYNVDDIPYLNQLLTSMTANEIKLLIEKSFDEIWNYAWTQNSVSNFKHTNEFIDSKQKFEYIKNNNILLSLICEMNTQILHEQEWGFPKGRRKLKENDLDCAIREFCEESRLTIDNIEIIKDLLPFEEIFFGTNNVLYKHTYYIAKIKDADYNIDISIDKNCIEQVREVRALKWFSYDDVLKHINTYNIERHQIIKETNLLISKYENIL